MLSFFGNGFDSTPVSGIRLGVHQITDRHGHGRWVCGSVVGVAPIRGTEPGLEIFSPQWMSEVGDGIPITLHPLILELCSSFGLGNSFDPQTICYTIIKHKEELRAYLGESG